MNRWFLTECDITCDKCYYNFDGVCANHTPEPEEDRYGKKIADLNGCSFGRPVPPWVCDQADPSKE